jgi:hypothetical protein
MVAFIDHTGHGLWDVERQGHAPKTDADWTSVEEYATEMAAAGSLIALGGTGVHDMVYQSSPAWQKWSRALSDAGLVALKASKAKNMAALIEANGQLVDVCEACHKEFKPSIPSEGLTHTHRH